jgi:hypothetical protein
VNASGLARFVATFARSGASRSKSRAFATRGAFSDANETGASSHRRLRTTLAVLALAIAAFAITAAPASAAPPSAKMGTISEVSYTSAHVTGKVSNDTPGCFGNFNYSFEYSTDKNTWSPGGGDRLPGTAVNKEVEKSITLPRGGTKYFVRLSVDNCAEPVAFSPQPYPSFTTLTVDPPSVVSTDNASDVAYTTATVKGKVNRPSNPDHAFDVNCHFQYVTDDQFQTTGFTDNPGDVPCEGTNPIEAPGSSNVEAHLTGLANDTAYHLRLVVSNGSPTTDAKEAASTFTTLTVAPPSVNSIENASEVEYSQAQVKGVVERPGNPDPAFDINSCNFEYISDDQFNDNPTGEEFVGATPVACEGEIPITATGPTPVKATLPGLSLSTTYHLRLSASNLGGSDAKEAAATFTTKGPVPAPSVVSIDDATDVTIHEATVKGEVKRPAGKDPALDVGCRFEFIDDAQFNANPPGEEFAGAGRADCIQNPITEATVDFEGKQPVTAQLGGLRADTTFHLRLVAENVGGTDTKEATGTFKTLPADLPIVTIDPLADIFNTAHISGTVTGGSGPFLCIYQISTDNEHWDNRPSGPFGGACGGEDFTSLQPETTYFFRIAVLAYFASDRYGGYEGADAVGEVAYSPVLSTTTEPFAAPTVTLDPVTDVAANSAHFSGEVKTNAPAGPLTANAKAAYKTDWHFECTPECPQQPGLSGTVLGEEGAQPVSLNAVRLLPNVYYEVKLVVHNAAYAAEPVRIFQTPLVLPTVTSNPGGSDGTGGYVLEGIVNSNNSKVSDCHFEYGTTATYPNTYKVDCLPSPSGPDEVQQVNVDATEGQFKLSFRGQSTSDLPYNATPAAVQAALRALSPIGPSGLAVSGSPGAYKVTFGGKLAGANIEQLKAVDGTTPLGGGGGASVSTTTVGGKDAPVTVEAHLEGLTVGATYHFRIFATNAAGTASSPDRSFVPTKAPPSPECPNEQLRRENNSLELPECRAYETVSSPNKAGNSAQFLDFSGGDALAYVSEAPNIAGSGQGGWSRNFYVATRAAAGWETTPNLNGSSGSLAGAPEYAETLYLGDHPNYSADLLSSIWSLRKKDSPEGVYLRRPDGSFVLVAPADGGPLGGLSGALVGVSDDLSHVVYNGHGCCQAGASFGDGVYEFVGTGNDLPRRIDVDNLGSPVSPCQMGLGGNAVSTDGNAIFYTAYRGCSGAPPANEIWARVDGTTSYDVSASQCDRTAPADPCNAPVDPVFVDSAPDGSRVYFTTTQQLVNGDTDQTNDLYACDIPTAPQAPVGTANPCSALHEVSAGSAGKADVQQVLRVSDDGSTASFTAKGVLADNEDALGEKALPGDNNLYVWRTDASDPDGQTTFVASLPQSEGPGVQTTPDGRYLLLQTAGQLLPTDTDEATDIYRYDADTEEMTRVSTAVSGTGGNGDFDARLGGQFAISDNGKLIVFQTGEALSPLDGNGEPDAYLWNDGHTLGSVAPLLPGKNLGSPTPGQVYIDGSGQDVYVETAARLTPTDVDFGGDVYDVRIGGGFPRPQEGCAGATGACQSYSSAPAPTPAPATAQPPADPGNVVPRHCRKDKVLKGNRCVKKPHKKHSGKKHHGKQASHKQGGGK